MNSVRTFLPVNERPIVKWTYEGGRLFSHYRNGDRILSDHDLTGLLNLVAAGRVVEVK